MTYKLNKALSLAAVSAAAFIIILTAKNIKKPYSACFTEYFDTVTDITVIANNDIALSECEEYIKKMDRELSAEDENGLIYRFNRSEAVELSDDTNELIDYAKAFTSQNPDLFSVYLDPLIKAWDIKNNKGNIPDVSAALSECKKKNTVNLGGIAKGFVTDRLISIVKSHGISSALINLGGNTYALGKKSDGAKWQIGIQDPQNENEIIGVIEAENIAVITSGDYQRYFEAYGVRYHHIFDPKTGFPVKNGLHSVTVISDDPTLCDALSTAVFVAGIEEGNELLKKYNCLGLFITDDTVYIRRGLENKFKKISSAYSFEFID